ncbi:CesT family type III secretion system chaperone [Chromobacterium vaccinii]|uniref:CesT family type III secretion system chaperone n=1 Tax=Chromobacterium vaccinii TaxID=1108595 RepID=UPI000617CD00|nr:CesT family type III secretion system chaperone [Chromobacterium vaccinii]QND84936.1 Uncharacterized protein ChrSW_2710 [Chromobacterium vaccinii]QND90167.1 Uncharacterized protein ChrSV_2710 [Chromobacterium vaccinii]SUX55477.1 Tir chaperone protein (CesT) [Chromobacterium vaccinii]
MDDLFLDALLTELGERIGLGGLAFDAQGHCDLLLDGMAPIVLRKDADNGRLVMIGHIDSELPLLLAPEQLSTMLEMALNPLLGQEPGIGWSQELGLVAYQSLAAGALSADRMEDCLAGMVLCREKIMRQLLSR